MTPDFERYKQIPHGPQDYQSLLMHIEAVRLVRMDDSLTVRLLDTLKRWRVTASPRSIPLQDVWVEIITDRDWNAALEETERGNQIRQSSPMATLLPNETRFAIIEKVKQLKDSIKT